MSHISWPFVCQCSIHYQYQWTTLQQEKYLCTCKPKAWIKFKTTEPQAKVSISGWICIPSIHADNAKHGITQTLQRLHLHPLASKPQNHSSNLQVTCTAHHESIWLSQGQSCRDQTPCSRHHASLCNPAALVEMWVPHLHTHKHKHFNVPVNIYTHFQCNLILQAIVVACRPSVVKSH